MTFGYTTIEISDSARLPQQPLVTVYMATYNHASFLAQAIEGVLAQRMREPYELIIGEDCSIDGGAEIARAYQLRHPDIVRVVTAEGNVGPHANATRCFARVRGEYLAYCEGDDYWTDPEKLARQLAVFREYPESTLVFHAASVVDAASGRPLRRTRPALRSRFIATPDVILGDGGMMPTASIMVRSHLPRNRPDWWRDAPVGDYPLALKAAADGRIAYVDRVMSVYRWQVPGSWTSRHVPRWHRRLDYARAIERMFKGFNQETGGRYASFTARVVSKYYSDVVVRLRAPRAEKRHLLDEVSDKLGTTDRILARASANTGLPLADVKSLWRKARTLERMLHGELTQNALARSVSAPAAPPG